MNGLDLLFLKQRAELVLAIYPLDSIRVNASEVKELVDRLLAAEKKLEDLEGFVKSAVVLAP